MCQVSASTREEFTPRPKYWTIIGGDETGGLVVKSHRYINSYLAAERLSYGAVVEQKELHADRLHFRLLEGFGTGPARGWVSIKTSKKKLASRLEEYNETAEEPIEVPANTPLATNGKQYCDSCELWVERPGDFGSDQYYKDWYCKTCWNDWGVDVGSNSQAETVTAGYPKKTEQKDMAPALREELALCDAPALHEELVVCDVPNNVSTQTILPLWDAIQDAPMQEDTGPALHDEQAVCDVPTDVSIQTILPLCDAIQDAPMQEDTEPALHDELAACDVPNDVGTHNTGTM